MKRVRQEVRRPKGRDEGQAMIELIAVAAFIALVATMLLTSDIPQRIVDLLGSQIDKIADLAG
jgi:hypothetical protein